MMKTQEITINLLNRYDSLIENEIFSKNIDVISTKLGINKNILLCYILNEGDISDIIDGVELICIDHNNRTFKLSFEDNINLKENIIKNDLLYNISVYCALNGFSHHEYFESGYNNIVNKNDDLFNKQICFEIDKKYYNEDSFKYEVTLLIDVDKERDLFLTDKFLEELEEHNEDAFYKLEEYLEEELVECIDGYSYIPFEMQLTNSLKDNLSLIQAIVEKEFKDHEKEIKKIKDGCSIFFEKK